MGTKHKRVVRTTEEQEGYQGAIASSKPALETMKQLHKNAGLPYIERKETGRACDLTNMTGKHMT